MATTLYVKGYVQQDYMKYIPDMFEVHISIIESRCCFVHNQQCTTTHMAPPLMNLFFI